MDELVRHCIRELAFAGELGCTVGQLRQFVSEFYLSRLSVQQNVDDAYFGFVWTILVQHPSISVGIPIAHTKDIPAAPKRRKKGTEAKEGAPQTITTTQLQPVANGRTRSYVDVVDEFGDTLRVAVDEQTYTTVITNSHTRPPNLTDLLFTTLQLIARQREQGISVLEIGKTTGYDQKACFYHVKKLCELDLIVKLRRAGNSQNFCVHKHFFDNSTYWKNIRTTEHLDLQEQNSNQSAPAAEGNDDDGDNLGFTPIDTRHLTSLVILRSRLIKLLKQSPNNMYLYENIAPKIGFQLQSRTERRFFLSRLGELLREGSIEKTFLQNKNASATSVGVPYLRLVEEKANPPPENAEKEQVNRRSLELFSTNDSAGQEVGMKSTLTLQRQIISVIDDAGKNGTTLLEISEALGDFDKRTVEHLLVRMEANLPPLHLADQALVKLEEFYGREKRYRYYTLEHYLAQKETEQLGDASISYGSSEVKSAKGFMDVVTTEFYQEHDELVSYLDNYQSVYWNQATKPNPKSNSKKTGKVRINPILPDGSRKRGRPRKDSKAPAKPKKQRKNSGEQAEVGAETSTAKRGVKRKAAESVDGDAEQPGDVDGGNDEVIEPKSVKRRGRPPKKRKVFDEEVILEPGPSEPLSSAQLLSTTVTDSVEPTDASVGNSASACAAPKKKRGRPPKNKPIIDASDDADGQLMHVSAMPTDDDQALERSGQGSGTQSGYDEQADAERDVQIDDFLPPTDNVDVESQAPATVTSQADQAQTTPKSSARARKPSSRARAMVRRPTSTVGTPGGRDHSERSRSRSPVGEPHCGVAVPDVAPPQPQASEQRIESVDGNNSSNFDDGPDRSISIVVEDIAKSIPVDESRVGKKSLTLFRRQNEILRLAEQHSGIINTFGTAFIDLHVQLVESMAKNGDPTSCPVGTRLDKKTLLLTLESLESAGRMRLLTASLPSLTGAARTVKIAYLPSVPEIEVKTYLTNLGTSCTNRFAVAPNADGNEVVAPSGDTASLAQQWFKQYDTKDMNKPRWHRNQARAQELFKLPIEAIQEALLMERQTVSQILGFIPGKLQRARALHAYAYELSSKLTESSAPASQHHILEWKHLSDELPLSVYCAIVPQQTFHPKFKELLDSAEGRKVPIKDVHRSLKPLLHSAFRLRFHLFDLLTDLETLKLLTPLQEVDSETAQIRFINSTGEMTAFNPSPPTWSLSVKDAPPQFWKFSEHAPIFLVASSNDSSLFYGDFPLETQAQRDSFWETLRNTSLDKKLADALASEQRPHQISCQYSPRLISSLTSLKHWQTSYSFSWFQERYLKTYINYGTYRTPCDEEGKEQLIQAIADVIHAPYTAVEEYYIMTRAEFVHELDKRRKRAEIAKKAAEKRAEHKKFLAAKAEESRIKDLQRWNDMVYKYESTSLSEVQTQRIKRLRDSFLKSLDKDTSKWEAKLDDLFKVTRSAEISNRAQKLFRLKKPTTDEMQTTTMHGEASAPRHGLPMDLKAFVKEIEEIIARQKNAFAGIQEASPFQPPEKKKKAKGKGKGKEKEVVEGGRQRKHRFKWNKDFDELLKDASVIVRSRCKALPRLDWGALDQVFPFLPRNSVRQHLVGLRETPGMETYLDRLQQCWHELWMKKRGSTELPEHASITSSNFDLKTHIAFLRKHLDKNAIRVGIMIEDETNNFELPMDVAELMDKWDFADSEKKDTPGTWEFLWNGITEEGREKQALEEAFVIDIDDVVVLAKEDGLACVAESAIKMIFGTPNEVYDEAEGSALLHSFGKATVDEVGQKLLSQNVLSKLVRDPKKAYPGRIYKISEANQTALGGQMTKELFVDATQLEDVYANQGDDWHEWPLLSTDGDTASILQLFSDHKVEMQVNTSAVQLARQSIDYASKKASDSEIEIQMFVKINKQPLETNLEVTPTSSVPKGHSDIALRVHGFNACGDRAACSKLSDGVSDCTACVELAMDKTIAAWPEDDQLVARSITSLISNRASIGVVMDAILDETKSICSAERCVAIVDGLSSPPVPVLYSVGYSGSRLVSASQIDAWVVKLGDSSDESPVVKVFPRRWLDISGSQIQEVWDAAVRCVAALVYLRPGIRQAEVLWRLRWSFDRQEVLDVLKYLRSEKHLVPYLSGGEPVSTELLTEKEEEDTCWTINHEKHWYRVGRGV